MAQCFVNVVFPLPGLPSMIIDTAPRSGLKISEIVIGGYSLQCYNKMISLIIYIVSRDLVHYQ